jgi:hypothetical protein
MLPVKGVYDGKVVRLLEPVEVDRPYRVEVTFVEEIKQTNSATGEDNFDRFVGMWANMTSEEDKVFQSIMEERAGYFINRQYDIDDKGLYRLSRSKFGKYQSRGATVA